MPQQRSTSFFRRPVLEVTPELLGDYLCIRSDEGVQRYRMTELEAYGGEEDLACHASKGKTPRSSGLYEPGGVFYVYLIYGMYTMLNIVCNKQGEPQAILIRGVAEISGPGRLTRDLGITRAIHGEPAQRTTGVWFEKGETIPESRVERLPRVGVEYAAEWARVPWRFRIN